MSSPDSTLSRLAAPGAGLPAPELWIARLLFRIRHRLTSRPAAEAQFAVERDRIERLVAQCAPEEAAERVLIRRLRGLEDSSRHWSVWMTLDHLRIVNVATAGTIRGLLAGKAPRHVASTAAVKPSPAVDERVVAAFGASCDEITRVCAGAASLRTAARYAHPWFGPLDADGWHFLAGFHLGLHRRQIELIIQGLAAARGGVPV